MNKKIKIVFVVLVLIVMVFSAWRFLGSVGTDINFDETGHFVKDNPGLKPGVWYLIYEKPGAPALMAELVFDDKSTCVWGDRQGVCPDVFLPRSSLTRVRGTLMQNGAVRVVNAN